MHGVVDGGRGVPRDLRDGADRTDHAGVGGSEDLGAVAGDSAVPAGRQTVLGEGEAGPPAVAIATVRRYRESDPQGWEDYLAEVDELTGADAPIGDE